MKVDTDTIVKVNYTLRIKDGHTPQDMMRQFSVRFLYGRDRVLPSLEKALMGHEKGDLIEIDLPPEQAFGEHDPELVRQVPMSKIKEPERLEKGEFYHETDPNGNVVGFMVNEIREDSVVADFNHPAAGRTLVLSAVVEDVQSASMREVMAAMNLNRGFG